MIYILIFVLSQYQNPATTSAIEFDNLKSCQAAAAELQTQLKNSSDGYRVQVIMCAKKG